MGEFAVDGPGRPREPPAAHAQRRRHARRRAHPLLGVPDGAGDLRRRPARLPEVAPTTTSSSSTPANTPKDFAWARERVRGDARVENHSDRLRPDRGPGTAGGGAALAGARDPDLVRPRLLRLPRGRRSPAPRRSSRARATPARTASRSTAGPRTRRRSSARLLEEGRGDGVLPCGLGARDTLRLEAKMALYGNDIDDTVTAFEADLGWIVKMEQGRLPRAARRSRRRRRRACRASSSGSR